MPAIKWNSGLQIGVEMIDNDHKALITLIDELYSALEREATKEIIKDAFGRLEDYIRQHFAREEALMAEYNFTGYAGHVRQHRQFIKEVENLKETLLNLESQEVAERVIRFLSSWLIKHIVSEDTKLAHMDTRNKPTEHHTGILYWAHELARWLARNIAFSYRVLLMTLIPISAILVFSTITIWKDYAKLEESQGLDILLDTVGDSGALIHQLQAERGITLANISSGYSDFNDRIGLVRQRTDVAAGIVTKQLNTATKKIQERFLNQQKQTIKIGFNKINDQRNLVDKQSANTDVLNDIYTDFINDLLSIADHLTNVQMPHHLSNSIIANVSIMYFKEKVGMTRALGTKVIELGRIDPNDLQLFSELLGEQNGFLKTFIRMASPKQLELWKQMQNSDISIAARKLDASLLASMRKDRALNMSATLWWDTQSRRMDELRVVSKLLSGEIELRMNQLLLAQGQNTFFLVLIVASLLLMSAASCFLLILSVTEPVTNLTKALTILSTGDRSMLLKQELAEDELKQMSDAYELCRLGMLKHDYGYLHTLLSGQEINRFKKLSSTDSLTGVYNRRKFTALAERELRRACRYQTPLAVMMLDIDHFKQINDKYGHSQGDLVLKEVCGRCQEQIRECDILARMGGEEFAILTLETTQEQALELAERIRKQVAGQLFVVNNDRFNITVSIGVAKLDDTSGEFSLEDLLNSADKGLYEAKNLGRNRVY